LGGGGRWEMEGLGSDGLRILIVVRVSVSAFFFCDSKILVTNIRQFVAFMDHLFSKRTR
jgi:hypothetical protein